MKATLDSDETTFKLAKGTAAATDPVDLADRIPAGGISEVRQNYLTDNILAFADQSLMIPSMKTRPALGPKGGIVEQMPLQFCFMSKSEI